MARAARLYSVHHRVRCLSGSRSTAPPAPCDAASVSVCVPAVSFFSLCKQEEEQQRRARRAERRRAPSDTALQPQPARDEPGRKLPRPRLDSVPVAAAAPAPAPQQQPARGQEEEEGDTAVQLPAPAVPRPERQLAAAGFGLFGAADDEELSD